MVAVTAVAAMAVATAVAVTAVAAIDTNSMKSGNVTHVQQKGT